MDQIVELREETKLECQFPMHDLKTMHIAVMKQDIENGTDFFPSQLQSTGYNEHLNW